MIEGKRFSQVYIDKGTPSSDSVRMRKRISSGYSNQFATDSNTREIVKLIHQETGAEVPFIFSSFSLLKFFEECEIRDLLDSITIIFQYLHVAGWVEKGKKWHEFISRVFKEENVGYRLDGNGGVHFYIDEEFERNKSTLIACLTSQPAVKESVERAYSFLDQDPQDTASAIRSIFEAVEILYKHVVNAEGKDRLNSMGVKSKLKPILFQQQPLANNQIALKAVDHLMDGLCAWIEAGHMYRHGQKLQEPSPPPLDFAVVFLSQGSSYLRYLLPLA